MDTVETEGLDRRIDRARVLEHCTIEMCEDARAVLAQRRGAILVTGHIGNWEAASLFLPWIGFDPLYTVAKAPSNRPLSMHLQKKRERRGLRLLARRGAMGDAAAIIRAGGSLAMLLDQRARKKPVIAPFFGRPARCDRGAGVLLRRMSAPVFFGVCSRTPRRWHYRLKLGPVWQPESIAHERPEEIARRINAEFERMILAAPEQYFWLHDRYRGAPEAAV